MRVKVEKWILTTTKQSNKSADDDSVVPVARNEQSVKSNSDIVIEQSIHLKQQLYQESPAPKPTLKRTAHNTSSNNRDPNQPTTPTHLSINFELINNDSCKKFKMLPATDESHDSGAQTSFKSEISIPINQQQQAIISWHSFQKLLDNSMDVFTLREAIHIIEELVKLEVHLTGEFNLNDKMLYFSSQKAIVDHLNTTLKNKLFSLSQSTELFNQLKKELIHILAPRLSTPNLSEALGQFEHLEHEYFRLVESTKSSLKLKIAKYEKHLDMWKQFDKTCRILGSIFDNETDSQSNGIQYRNLIILINNHLNSLKEKHRLLSSTCTESKYFEMKNLIIVYELKFKQLRDKYEADEAISCDFQQQTIADQTNSINGETQFENTSCQLVPLKRVETSDKSTFTVNETSTQTDTSTYLAEQDLRSIDRQYSTKIFNKKLVCKRLSLTESAESDGKQLLLEAYLMNNKNLTNAGSSSSSCLLADLNNSKSKKKQRNSQTTSGTRESGLGTFNDDEVATSSCEFEFKTSDSCKLQSDEVNLSDDSLDIKHNDNSSVNEADLEAPYHNRNSPKQFVKVKKSKQSQSLFQRQHKSMNEKTKRGLSSDKATSSFVNAKDTAEAGLSWLLYFLRKFFSFLLILLPVCFLLFVYFFYILFLNQNCCDLNRNYLFLNIS